MKPLPLFLLILCVAAPASAPAQQSATPPRENQLKSLEFLIGDWVAEGAKGQKRSNDKA